MTEVGVEGLDQGACHLGAPFRRGEQRLVLLARQVARLQQHRGNIGRAQYPEPRRTVRLARQAGHALKFLDDPLGERDRRVLGLALGEVDEDAGDLVAVAAEIDAGDHVGAVFLFRQGFRLAVRGLLGQGVDGGAAHRGAAQAVGVQGDEQVGAVLAGETHPLGERDEHVALARQLHLIPAGGEDPVAHGERQRQNHVLLQRAPDARRARIDAAVAGVEHDHPLAGGFCSFRFRRRRRWRRRRSLVGRQRHRQCGDRFARLRPGRTRRRHGGRRRAGAHRLDRRRPGGRIAAWRFGRVRIGRGQPFAIAGGLRNRRRRGDRRRRGGVSGGGHCRGGRQAGGEGLCVGGDQVHHHAGGLAVLGGDDERLLDEDRARHIHDDARPALLQPPVAIGRNQPPALRSEPLRQPEGDFGEVHDHPVGRCDHVNRVADRSRQVGNEAGPYGVAGDPGRMHDGNLRGRRVGGRGRAERQRPDRQTPDRGNHGGQPHRG